MHVFRQPRDVVMKEGKNDWPVSFSLNGEGEEFMGHVSALDEQGCEGRHFGVSAFER